jgi:hypothetical protein
MTQSQPSPEAAVVASHLVRLMTEGFQRSTGDAEADHVVAVADRRAAEHQPSSSQWERFREVLAGRLDALKPEVLPSLERHVSRRDIRENAARDAGISPQQLAAFDRSARSIDFAALAGDHEGASRTVAEAALSAGIDNEVNERWSTAIDARRQQAEEPYSGRVLRFRYDTPAPVAEAASESGISVSFLERRLPMKTYFEFGRGRVVVYSQAAPPQALMGSLNGASAPGRSLGSG